MKVAARERRVAESQGAGYGMLVAEGTIVSHDYSLILLSTSSGRTAGRHVRHQRFNHYSLFLVAAVKI
jgi:hypothetical protein